MISLQQSTLSLRLMPRLGKSWRRWSNRRNLSEARTLAQAILTSLPSLPDLPPPSTWHIQQTDWTLTDTVVMTLCAPGQDAAAILKLPQREGALTSLEQQAQTLSRLARDGRLADWQHWMPRLLAKGIINGQHYFLEQVMPGSEGRLLLHSRAADEWLHLAAAQVINGLHRRTVSCITVDGPTVARWVELPIARLGQLQFSQPDISPRLDALRQELRQELHAKQVNVSWIHGDFWASNILANARGASLTGIVDWDRAAPDMPPEFDLLHLVVQRRKLLARQSEPGHAIADLLSDPWTQVEHDIFAAAESTLPDHPDDRRAMLLLYWLHIMNIYLEQNPTRANQRDWVTTNIEEVLTCC